MKISIIAAVDRARGIGLAGQLPWHLSADLKQFKKRTMGHTLIQGRKTWESIGRPLPGRRMVVLTRQADYAVPDGITVCHSLADALDFARENGDDEAFIGWGANVFTEALDIADRIYLTRVDAVVESDTYFPAFDESEWSVQTLESHSPDERNEHAFRLDLLERKKNFIPGEDLMTERFSDLITFFYTRDLKTTSRFYEDVLGLEMVLDQGSCRVYRVTERGYVGFCERDNAPEKPEGKGC